MDVILACLISFYIGFMIGRNKEFCKNRFNIKEYFIIPHVDNNNYEYDDDIKDDSNSDNMNIIENKNSG